MLGKTHFNGERFIDDCFYSLDKTYLKVDLCLKMFFFFFNIWTVMNSFRKIKKPYLWFRSKKKGHIIIMYKLAPTTYTYLPSFNGTNKILTRQFPKWIRVVHAKNEMKITGTNSPPGSGLLSPVSLDILHNILQEP